MRKRIDDREIDFRDKMNELTYLNLVAQIARPQSSETFPLVIAEDQEELTKKLKLYYQKRIHSEKGNPRLAHPFDNFGQRYSFQPIIDFSTHIDTVNRFMWVEEMEPYKTFIQLMDNNQSA